MTEIPSDRIALTYELIMSLRTPRGAFSRKTIEALGLTWPPTEGWPRRIVGTSVPRQPIEALIADPFKGAKGTAANRALRDGLVVDPRYTGPNGRADFSIF